MTLHQPAIFLDRDGTLIEDRGHLSLTEQVEFFRETVPALKRLRGFRLFIVTNQSGVGQGVIRAEEAAAVNRFVVDQLRRDGITIDEIYCCPHRREDGCSCIKPNAHFAHLAARDHDVDLTRSFVVGDHPCDVDFANNSRAHGIYVLTGHGEKHRDELSFPCDVVANIEQAVDRILAIHSASVLRRGGLVALPTETVYGLSADADNAQAIERVFTVKGRPTNHPLIVHLADKKQLPEWASPLTDTALRLAERFWPGPLTLILPRAKRVLDAVTGGQESVGIRIPAHPLALAMLREFQGGVAAPSANRFGLVSPTTADHVRQDLGEDVDFIADGGPCEIGVESTIVSLVGERAEILRPGGVSREELQATLGYDISIKDSGLVRVSGQLISHYAPTANVMLISGDQLSDKAKRLGEQGYRVEILSERDIEPASLFASLRRADEGAVDVVLVTLPPEQGLGAAVADRLRKAAAGGLAAIRQLH